MNDMYQIIEALCAKSNISVAALAREVKISKSTMSELKAGRSQSLSAKNMEKIADYFGVTMDYLLGNKEKPATETSDELDNEFFAFYGEVKPYFDEDDINDIKIFMQMKAEYKKKKNDKG